MIIIYIFSIIYIHNFLHNAPCGCIYIIIIDCLHCVEGKRFYLLLCQFMCMQRKMKITEMQVFYIILQDSLVECSASRIS